jgi:uncharacterized delta-60 repeat protein
MRHFGPKGRLVLGALVVAVLGLLALPAAAAPQQPGSLDSSWGAPNGYVLGPGTFPGAQAVTMQGDKVVAVGGDVTSNDGDFVVARYNKNGSPDGSFGTGGSTTVDFGQVELASGVVMMGDKIVVVGYTCDSDFVNCDFAIARLTKNGALDSSFDDDGMQTVAFGNDDEADAVDVAGDKIVVAGFSDGDFAFARLTKDGSLDSSFDSDGKQTVDFGDYDSANAVRVVGDKIVAAGYTYGGMGGDFAITRLNKNGSLDASFNGTGKQTTDFAAGRDAGHALDVKGDRILVVGEAYVGHSQAAAVMYTKDGGYDTKFSGDGKTTMDVGPDARGYGGAFGPGEAVVAAGYTCFQCAFDPPYQGNKFFVARWTKDGSVDTGFGTTNPGYTQTDVGGTDDSGASALVLGPEDKIVAAGYSGDQFAIARYINKK